MPSSSDRAAELEFPALREIYALQQESLQKLMNEGRRLVGVKTALLGPEAQRRMHAPGPVCGWLTEDMELTDAAELTCRPGMRTKAEAEVVFVLGSDLFGPGVTEVDVLQATSAIQAGIELPGTRLDAPPADVREFVEQNTSAGRFMVGRPQTSFAGIDLSLLGVVVERDGEVVASGAGARVMGDPARSVAWLANSLAEMGFELRAGMVVFTGSLADPIEVLPGQTISADFAHLGRVGFRAV